MTGKNNGLPSRQKLIDAISRADFYSFVQRIFPIVSAGSPFLPNWHVEAMTWCTYLRHARREQASDHHGAAAEPEKHLCLCRFSGFRARPRPDKTHH